MSDVLTKACSFIFIIILGYLLKKFKILKVEDRTPILNLVFYITIPSILISSFKTFVFSPSLIIVILLGALGNAFILFIAYLFSIKSTNEFRKTCMMVPAGFSIGTFTIPFAATFLGPESLIVIAMFDIGNAVMGLGGTYAIVSGLTGSSQKGMLKEFIKRLFTSVPFITYLVMFTVSLIGITIPDPVYVLTDFAGSASMFLIMVSIGIMLELKIPRESFLEIVKLLGIRYFTLALIVLILVYILPFPNSINLPILFCVLSPPATNAIIFAQKLNCDTSIISSVQTIAIPISIACSSVLIFIGNSI